MALKINPAKIAVWRDTSTLQIGLDDGAPRFENLETNAEKFIDLLYRSVAEDAVPDLADELKLANPQALIERLRPTLLRNEKITNGRLPQEFLRGAFAEIIRASYRTDRDGVAVLEARAKATVAIDHLDRAGLLIALALAATGVGRILTRDVSRVAEADVGPIAYPRASVGKTRIEALLELISNSGAVTVVADETGLTPAKSRRELTVLVATHVLHPSRYRSLAKEPHLSVVFGSDAVSVSPVLRGSPCHGCLEHWRAEADSAWPAIASQLLGRLDYLEDAVSAMHAAASCIALILDEIDGLNVENLGARYEVKSKTLSAWTWTKHPACACG